ncbi:hypothetical protein ACFSC4_08725 [Deinococcus malanensis]|uniref:hypothetical protein n=1 Tax=Deinococcus malanensis TaxID=1706855 RepID=UPI00362AD549
MDIAERYIRLAHAIDAHAPGFIDGYGGPQEWADRQERDPAQLRLEANDLAVRVEEVAEEQRRAWLAVQVRAMQTMTRLLAGEQLRYSDEVRGLYDIEPRRADPAALDASLRVLEDALPGSGSLVDRKNALRDRVVVPPSALLDVTAPILAELRERTRTRFGLPQGKASASVWSAASPGAATTGRWAGCKAASTSTLTSR